MSDYRLIIVLAIIYGGFWLGVRFKRNQETGEYRKLAPRDYEPIGVDTNSFFGDGKEAWEAFVSLASILIFTVPVVYSLYLEAGPEYRSMFVGAVVLISAIYLSMKLKKKIRS